MNKIFNNIFGICIISISGCGDGQNSEATNYYSASFDTYYQIESSESSYSFNIVSSSGNSLVNVPLTTTSNGYTFSASYNGQSATGNIVINNGQMGISINASSNGFTDFATLNTNNNLIPDGVYTTVCDQNNISACNMVINGNTISVTEYSVSGESTILCSNQSLTNAINSVNPNLLSFSCGVQGGTYNGIWNIMPLIVNNTVAIMISEYNASINQNDNGTDEIAFPELSFMPNGSYNYVYNPIASGQSGISNASFSNGVLINNIVGTCDGAMCALITNQYAGIAGGNSMVGFNYYSVNGQLNYNLVGNDTMNIYVDSYVGIYY